MTLNTELASNLPKNYAHTKLNAAKAPNGLPSYHAMLKTFTHRKGQPDKVSTVCQQPDLTVTDYSTASLFQKLLSMGHAHPPPLSLIHHQLPQLTTDLWGARHPFSPVVLDLRLPEVERLVLADVGAPPPSTPPPLDRLLQVTLTLQVSKTPLSSSCARSATGGGRTSYAC